MNSIILCLSGPSYYHGAVTFILSLSYLSRAQYGKVLVTLATPFQRRQLDGSGAPASLPALVESLWPDGVFVCS